MSSNRPTHGRPLNDAEKSAKRGIDAGVKNWQAGLRFEWSGRGGLYKSRTGNSNGIKKVWIGGGPKPPTGTPRVVHRPHWARKYDA